MKYIVKHNIPDFSCKGAWTFPNKDAALDNFNKMAKECMEKGYPVKSYLREDENKPLRATLQVEVDNFTYYAELYAQ